jgi:hypothetical protein
MNHSIKGNRGYHISSYTRHACSLLSGISEPAAPVFADFSPTSLEECSKAVLAASSNIKQSQRYDFDKRKLKQPAPAIHSHSNSTAI